MTDETNTPAETNGAPPPTPRAARTLNGVHTSFQCDPGTRTRIEWLQALMRELQLPTSQSLVVRMALAHFATYMSTDPKNPRGTKHVHTQLEHWAGHTLAGAPLLVTTEEACASPVRSLTVMVNEKRDALREKLEADRAAKLSPKRRPLLGDHDDDEAGDDSGAACV